MFGSGRVLCVLEDYHALCVWKTLGSMRSSFDHNIDQAMRKVDTHEGLFQWVYAREAVAIDCV